MIRKLIILFFTALIIFTLSSCSKEQKEYKDTSGNTVSDLEETENEIFIPEATESESETSMPEETETETETESETSIPEETESESSVPEETETENETPVPEETETETESETPVPEETETETESETSIPEETETESETSVPEETESEDGSDISHYIPVPEEWNLIVVNKWNKIPDGYTVELTELPNGKKVDSRIHLPLQKMFEAALAENVHMIVREAYRTTEEQQQLLDERIQIYLTQGYSQSQAEKKAKEWVAVPGTSEHELGLAVDINADSTHGYNQLAYKWLEKNAHKYGFILRYPKGKEDITGIANEPWHYRYVGVETATEIYQSGICLEEYLQLHYNHTTEEVVAKCNNLFCFNNTFNYLFAFKAFLYSL